MEPTQLYAAVGGAPFFERLVDAFYDGVAADPLLLPLYPDAPELKGARRRLTLFLIQYWGGPATYSDERGHPRLRLRHLPFTIGPAERDAWLAHMTRAVDLATGELEPETASAVRELLLGYFVPASEQLRNDTGLPITVSSALRSQSERSPMASRTLGNQSQ